MAIIMSASNGAGSRTTKKLVKKVSHTSASTIRRTTPIVAADGRNADAPIAIPSFACGGSSKALAAMRAVSAGGLGVK